MAEDSGARCDASQRSTAHEHEAGPQGAGRCESDGADLTVEQILSWADAYHAEHGTWPTVGPLTPTEAVAGAPGESWKAINHALVFGLRGLPGDSSLAELLAEHRGAPPPDMRPQALAEKIWAWEQEHFPVKRPRLRQRRHTRPDCPGLTIDAILGWCDAHRAATGQWPTTLSGPVRDAPFALTWNGISSSLKKGNRGLPGGSSLVQLLIERRGLWPELTIERILAWADAHHAATGRWPSSSSGKVLHAPGEVWSTLNLFLKKGGRGLPGGQNLCGILAEHRDVVNGQAVPRWSVAQVLAWADAYHAAKGRWPSATSGPVEAGAGARVTWGMINSTLREGRNGLPGGTTLTRLLIEHRGPEACNQPPHLTLEQVRAWFHAHHAATGKWPTGESGPVRDAPHPVTWKAIAVALAKGSRGLPPGLSLARLRPGYVAVRPPLTVPQILAWADAHHAAKGQWPNHYSGKVQGASGEFWSTICTCLRDGGRGLPGGQSLAELLVAHRGMRNQRFLPRLSVEQILAWADAHFAAHGRWPGCSCGRVEAAPGETWRGIDRALWIGRRGLSGGTTVVRLLIEHGRRRRSGRTPGLTQEQILAWADAHHAATGRWPNRKSGEVAGTRGETWARINGALHSGTRGLAGGTTLVRLLSEHRGVRNHRTQPRLTEAQILAWADAHQAARGEWPNAASGAVTAAPGETWSRLNAALWFGHRGLAGGQTLARLLAAHRPVQRPPLTVETIRAWAEAQYRAAGAWPTARQGPVASVPGESWYAINKALRLGQRGLPGGSSLAKLLAATPGRVSKPCGPRPKLTVDQILAWAKAHHAATGGWPRPSSGPVAGAPGETWNNLHDVLVHGSRGLPAGTGLAKLIRRRLDPTAAGGSSDLTVDQILAWADAHHARTGRWPVASSGLIPGAPGEKWCNLDAALRKGSRGLPSGSSLRRLLVLHRNVSPNQRHP
jgi:hypothetical protein